MSNENEETQGMDQNSGGEDLSAALGGSETEFVISDEKKPAAQGLLYLALVVALAGGGMYFMYKRQGPSSASAAPAPEVAKAEATINTFLTSGPSGIKAMQEMLKDTEKVVKQFLEYPSVTQIPLSDLHTNPFRVSKADDQNPDGEKQKRKREEEKQAAIKASEALQLQSIMHSGARKACMINNTLYQEGQQVDQFTIEKIEPSRVIIKSSVYRFELKMQK
jgi:hypothetical protein